jgi:hypothetical protein
VGHDHCWHCSHWNPVGGGITTGGVTFTVTLASRVPPSPVHAKV